MEWGRLVLVYATGQVSKSLFSFPTWGVVITPPYPTKDILVHCVAKDFRSLGTLPQRCAGTHGHPQPLRDASDDPCFSDATGGFPFLEWDVLLLCFSAGECLLPPFPTDALGRGSVSQHASQRVQ